MASPGQSTTEKQLASLQAKFKSGLPGKVENIEQLWNSVSLSDIDESIIFDCHRMAHTLVGSGGTFGAISVSVSARELEQALKLLIDKKSVLTPDYKSVVSRLILKLKKTSDSWQPSKIPYLEPIASENKENRKNNLIFLAEDDELVAREIIKEL